MVKFGYDSSDVIWQYFFFVFVNRVQLVFVFLKNEFGLENEKKGRMGDSICKLFIC